MDGILVANKWLNQVAVAFFKPKHEGVVVLGFVLVNLIGNPLETGQDVDHFDPVAGRNLSGKVGGDNRLNGRRVGWQGAGLLVGFQDVVQHQGSNLVPSQQLVFTIGLTDRTAHPVGIRVGSDQDVGIDLLPERNRASKGFRKFRVRVL